MISVAHKRKVFQPVFDYFFNKDKAELLVKSGLMALSPKGLVKELLAEAESSKRCKKPCFHFSLAIPAEDKDKLSNADFVEIAGKYLKKLKLEENQFIIFKHNDTENPHVHVMVNLVREGKAVSLSNNFYKMQRLDRQIEAEYNLKVAPLNERGKEKEASNLKGNDRFGIKEFLGEDVSQSLQEEPQKSFIPSAETEFSKVEMQANAQDLEKYEKELKTLEKEESFAEGHNNQGAYAIGRNFKNHREVLSQMKADAVSYGADYVMNKFMKNPREYGELNGNVISRWKNKKDLKQSAEHLYKYLQAVENSHNRRQQMKYARTRIGTCQTRYKKAKARYERGVNLEKVARFRHYERQAKQAEKRFKDNPTKENALNVFKAEQKRDNAAWEIREDAKAFDYAKGANQAQKLAKSLEQSKANDKSFAKAAAYRIDAQKVVELGERASNYRAKGEAVPEVLWDEMREAQYKRDFSASRVVLDDKAKSYIENTKTLEVHARRVNLPEKEKQPSYVAHSRRWGTLDKMEKELSFSFARSQSSYVLKDLEQVKKAKGELAKTVLGDKEAQKGFSEKDLENVAKTARRMQEKQQEKENSLER